MTYSGRSQWQVPAVVALLAITSVLVLSAGCTQQAPSVQENITTVQSPVASGTPVATAQEGKKMVTFTEKDNGTTASIAAGTRFAVQLRENPTTGYSWNASTSAGLTILSSDYVVDKHAEGMTGVGGTRTWILLAAGTGNQTFNGVYKQSWMPTTGNETTYVLGILIPAT
ncbi:MAG: protease inhibitor I42 family protein [Methanoregula sp.]|nr:protease inhibitor I42 family protein [Methanoregula sp.]